MTPEVLQILVPIIVALIVGAFGFAGGFWAYRKNRSDAAKNLVDSAMSLVKEYKESLDDCNEKSAKIVEDQQSIINRANAAEKLAAEAQGKVEELEKTVIYLRERIEEGKRDREHLHEMVGVLETQLESLGYTPRSKTSKTRKTDIPHTKE